MITAHVKGGANVLVAKPPHPRAYDGDTCHYRRLRVATSSIA